MTPAVRGCALALGTAGISGLAVFVNSYGVKAFGDATIYTTAKNAVAGAFLLLFLPIAGPAPHPPGTVRGRPALGLLVVAVVGGSVPFVLFFEGLAHSGSGPTQAQFINKTLVAWVALLAVLTLGERVGRLQLLAVLTLVAGQLVLAGGPSALADLHLGMGEAMILAATLLWAVEVVVAKRLLAEVDVRTLALARMVGGSGLLVGWVVLRGDGAQLIDLDATQWMWVVVTGALLAAYVATWFTALAEAPATTVTAILVAAVPVTALLQTVVQHAALLPHLSGLGLVAAGVALAAASAATARRPEPVRVDR